MARILLIGVLAAAFAGCASVPPPGSGAAADDAITARIKAAIAAEPTLVNQDIDVRTVRGKVRLFGRVDAQPDLEKAGEIAARVAGAASVWNDLAVKGGGY